MARPRVFVSSTYYDLKYARERLERFLEAYNMEPVLFESDEVYFQPNQAIDLSCYKEVQNCHIMVLIVGGRYGSLASDPNRATAKEEKDKYNAGHVSITQKEYETARKNNIPILIFIDRNVYADYRTFRKNKDSIPADFTFAHVDDIRIFDFISKLEQSAIKTFDKIEDIEQYFSNQISGMLYSYLESLKMEGTTADLKNTLDQIKKVSDSMNDMINLIGGKVVGSDKGEYDKLIEEQRKDLIDFFFKIFDQSYSLTKEIYFDSEKSEDAQENICKIILETIFNESEIEKIEKIHSRLAKNRQYDELENRCSNNIAKLEIACNFTFESKSYREALSQVHNKIKNKSTLQKYFKDKLKESIKNSLTKKFFYFLFDEKNDHSEEK